jgi:predicted site-specific integrase-resolvase
MKKIKLSKWAKINDVNYQTAYKWIKSNQFPDKYEYSDSGSIFVIIENPTTSTKQNYIYCRVSSNNKKEDLQRQINRCKSFSESIGLSINKIYKEVGSGMNDNRTQLNKLLEQPIGTIIIEHKDRLTRFGYNYIETLYAKLGGNIIVINKDESEESDLMKDLISIITSFCCRLYGMRKGYNKAKNIKENIATI